MVTLVLCISRARVQVRVRMHAAAMLVHMHVQMTAAQKLPQRISTKHNQHHAYSEFKSQTDSIRYLNVQ